LTAAYELARRGVPVEVFEADDMVVASAVLRSVTAGVSILVGTGFYEGEGR